MLVDCEFQCFLDTLTRMARRPTRKYTETPAKTEDTSTLTIHYIIDLIDLAKQKGVPWNLYKWMLLSSVFV